MRFGDGAAELSLLIAAARGDLATVTSLLAMGVNVNARGDDDMTALLWASERGKYDVVALLCSLPKTQLRMRESLYGRTALDTAKVFLTLGNDLLARKRILRILQSTQTRLCLASSLAGGSLVTVEFGAWGSFHKNLTLALSACTP